MRGPSTPYTLLGSLVPLTSRLGAALIRFLLAGLALGRLLRDLGSTFLAILLLRLLVRALDVGVGRCDAATTFSNVRTDDLIPGGVNDARPRLVLGLELDLALERLNLLLVEQVAVLVAVLDALLLGEELLALLVDELGCARDGLVWSLLVLDCRWLLCHWLVDGWLLGGGGGLTSGDINVVVRVVLKSGLVQQ